MEPAITRPVERSGFGWPVARVPAVVRTLAELLTLQSRNRHAVWLNGR